ncbi:hypothetical protein [Blastococcus sp. PRF04-17]|uniref:hypothetical protein n=1 Tax=Blastococcus sp. PRF04-17 TaxID=2933797 RepID=UPI001FF1A451|nr:hypothetical protein [Blastococcus sp. PRF04-17]UOY01994.1 hypothetical protein MVA48_00985 [Blastococcus sp. PRF04-17]
MSTPLRLLAFALGLVAVFGAAVGVGAAVGPVGSVPEEPAHDMAADPEAGGHAEEGGHEAPDALPAGLQVSEGGYTLALDSDVLPAGTAIPLSFRILGPDGHAVTAFDVEHEEDLHLIAVRRDLSGYQHVHPELSRDGTWQVPVDLTAGTWRVFADFVPSADGVDRVLGADLAVAGDHAPEPLPDPVATAEVDGYTVALVGELVPGEESVLDLTVTRDGLPVTDLQPYLGAHGHLVALRQGDLAYLHVHPVEEDSSAPGPTVRFATTAPSAGSYRLFLDFRHGDVVRTAAFTVEVVPHEEAHE